MPITYDVNLLRVMNPAMIVTKLIETPIRCMFIRVHDGTRQHSFLHEWFECACKDVRDHSSDDIALPLYRASNNGFMFAGRTAFLPSASIPANVSFVNFNLSAQWFAFFRKHLANLFEHAPRGFVANARFAFKLFRRDTATSRGHQIDRVKPRFQRRARLVIDRVRGRVNMMAAKLTRIRFTRGYLVMLRDLAARIAKDAVRVKVVFQPFETGIIGRKLALEILERVPRHPRALNFWLSARHRVDPFFTYNEGNTSRTYCQGIIT